MERMIWIFTSREGMVSRGEKAPSIPACLGKGGGEGRANAKIVCSFGEGAHSDGRYDFM